MRNCDQFYIDGQWVSPTKYRPLRVINPSTEDVAGIIALGSDDDVDRAVIAARKAFATFSRTSIAERLDLLKAIATEFARRSKDVAAAISEEMGAPNWLAEQFQVACGAGHLATAIDVLESFPFSESKGGTQLIREPVGVCAFITPWNWPINQIACKVVPALATGCTAVLKPSEMAPFSAILWADILDRAGVPSGVFNLVNGDGTTVGAALSTHPEVDMVSFTGSTAAGITVAKAAASTVKRVHQELGGKSADIIIDDSDFRISVAAGVKALMVNSGQSCNAPTRMLVPRIRYTEALDVARTVAIETTVGPPAANAAMGPVSSERQWHKIQDYIRIGIKEGANLIAGGEGRPQGLDVGYYVRPTIFGDVRNEMRIAREEIFGPVLVIIPYENEDEAIAIANDSPFGLAGYVHGRDIDRVRSIATQIRAGQIFLNNAPADFAAPFGGYKQSGNGREWGEQAFHEFLEVKAILGFNPPPVTQ